MKTEYDIKTMAEIISRIKESVMDLNAICADFPAVERNVNRILADVRVLELDICDVNEILSE